MRLKRIWNSIQLAWGRGGLSPPVPRPGGGWVSSRAKPHLFQARDACPSSAKPSSFAFLGVLVFLPILSTPSLARDHEDCMTDKDCRGAWTRATQRAPCKTIPKSDRLLAGMPKTQPPARTNERYVTEAVLETGPDDSPALRIQLSWPGSDRVVWTVLHGDTWQRIQRGELQARSSIRTCTGWGSPQSECLQHQGMVVFTTLRTKPGETVQGKIRYQTQQPGQDVVLPFTATLKHGGLL